MEKYFKRSFASISTPTPEDNLDDLPWDPAKRKKILTYHPNQRDEIRCKYLVRGPCKPYGHNFTKKMIGKSLRRFNPAWFDRYDNWLEYSVSEDKAFCLCCYLFRDNIQKQGGNDAFVTEGFSSWNKSERLASHVGAMNSFHNIAVKKCDSLMKQDHSIAQAFYKHDDVVKNEYVFG